MTVEALSPNFTALPLQPPPSTCPASVSFADPQQNQANRVVWVRGCNRCGELELSSFWGSAVLAKLVETRCRHCLSTEMAVCPVTLPAR